MRVTTKTKAPTNIERLNAVQLAIDFLKANLPDAAGASRIEIDIEWEDGGRVKVEARS